MRHFVAAAAVAALIAVGAPTAWAANVPRAINYQGELTQPGGTPVPDGEYELGFRIYNNISKPTDMAMWARAYDVSVINGRFNVILSSDGGRSLSSTVDDITEAFNGRNRYLGITIERDADGSIPNPVQEMLPRQQILSSPYAIRSGDGVPPGTILPFAGSDVPPGGYLPCDGRSVSMAEYPSLHVAIEETWGNGDDGAGGDSFSLPDLRGRVLMCVNPAGDGEAEDLSSRVLGETLGEETHELTQQEMPSHRHSFSDKHNEHSNPAVAGYDGPDVDCAHHSGVTRGMYTGHQGGGGAHNNIQPSAVVKYIIRY